VCYLLKCKCFGDAPFDSFPIANHLRAFSI
jgi:hypothetical protein